MKPNFLPIPASRRRGRVARILRDDRASITVVFAFCMSMMIAVMSIALNTIDGATSRARAQWAGDIAGISAAWNSQRYKTVYGNDLMQWRKDARAYYDANMPTGFMNITMQASDFNATMTQNSAGARVVSVSTTSTLHLLAPVVIDNNTNNAGSSNAADPTALGPNPTVSTTNQITFQPKGSIELVMVLDNTGSMADSIGGGQSKMDALKAAANTLLEKLTNTDVETYIGIVPFTTTVNLTGGLLGSGTWMAQDAFAYNHTNVAMTPSPDGTVAGWGGCAAEPRTSDTHYLYPNAYSPGDSMKFTPYYYNVPQTGMQVRNYTDALCGTPAATQSAPVMGVPLTIGGGRVNYCGFSPQGAGIGSVYDKLSSAKSTTKVTQNSDCIANPVTFLTNDVNGKLKPAISRMSPNGSTIVPGGLLWGWRMLDSDWSQQSAGVNNGWISDDKTLPRPETTLGLHRVLVVLSDGENSVGSANAIPADNYFNGLSGVGSNDISAPTIARSDGTALIGGKVENSSDLNTFQLGVCNAIKASGVTVYTITFGSVSSAAMSTMRNCATTGNYLPAPTNDQLDAAFNTIANNLSTLRLTQ